MQVVYVDVDDTLVRWSGTKAIPIPSVVAHVKALHAAGAELYCWSAAGADAARDVAERLGIDSLFRAFLPKPHVLIDDQAAAEWRGMRHVHPLDLVGAMKAPIDHGDDAQIDAMLARSPAERVRFLVEMVAFEDRARRARRVG